MKKKSLVVTGALFALACLASCNKSYTCTCTVTSKGVVHVISGDIGTTTKDDAQNKCDAMHTQYTDTVSGVSSACHL